MHEIMQRNRLAPRHILCEELDARELDKLKEKLSLRSHAEVIHLLLERWHEIQKEI